VNPRLVLEFSTTLDGRGKGEKGKEGKGRLLQKRHLRYVLSRLTKFIHFFNRKEKKHKSIGKVTRG